MPYIIMDGEVPDYLEAFDTYQAYNILDSAITAQLLPVINSKLANTHRTTYLREMRLQSLCLEMSTKGFPIDQFCLAELLWQLEKDEARALLILHKFCEAVEYRPINPNSPQQLADFFYSYLRLPAIYEYDRKTNKRKLSTDRKALEKLSVNYPIATPFISAIDACKTARKMASVFKRGLEPGTQNLRCNFSPTGTETGRLSSQQNPYGRGTNAQNLTDNVRQAITAPEGYAIVNLDLKTAESIAVGYISRDRGYIDACLSGDLHTSVAKLNWPELPWTGNLKADKAIAEQPYYRQFSYRDMAKRGGHGTNYYGTPRTMAMHLKLTTAIVQAFQDAYFAAFPGIPDWHLRVIAEIQTSGTITNALGRERRFWGRPNDPSTYREAIAFDPQSLVADVWNEGLMQLQDWIIRQAREVKPLNTLPDLRAQVHDSGVFLVPLDGLDSYIAEMQERLKFPVDFGDLGVMIIPTDAQVGKRWNKAPKKSGTRYTMQGLKDYSPGQPLHF